MKRVIFLLALFIGMAVMSQAQTIDYPFGAADYEAATIAGDTAIYITADNQWTCVSATIDTTVQVRVAVGDGIENGALLFVKLTADGTNRAITFPDGVTAAGETLTASKTKLWVFIYINDGFYEFAENQVN